MSKNEIVLKASQLDETHNCDAVVELLGEYVKENADDLEALALFQKNSAAKLMLDRNLNLDELYSSDAKEIFNSVPEESVLDLSEMLFAESIARVYLSESSEEEKEKLAFGYLYRAVSALGDRLNDADTLNDQLEKFYTVMETFGFGKYFYDQLAFVIDWKSKVAVNILKYLVKQSQSILPVASDEEIYDTYTKDMVKPLCAFDDKPYLSGGRLVIVDIRSEAEKEFWKGYFTLMKDIREKEYEEYRKIASDPQNPLYGRLSIGESVHKAYMNVIMKQLATSEEIARTQVAAGGDPLDLSESDFKDRIVAAEQSINTIKVNPIEQIKSFIYGLLGKK